MMRRDILIVCAAIIILGLTIPPVSALPPPGSTIVVVNTFGDGAFYFGETVKFWVNVTPGNAEIPYMFMTGPGLPAQGARLNGDPAGSPVTNGTLYGDTFTRPTIILDTFDFTLSEYDWATTETIALDAGTYTIYGETQPCDYDHVDLAGNDYGTTSIILEKPFITATADSYNKTAGSVFIFSGVKEGSQNPVNITITNNSAEFWVGSLPSEGVNPEDFSVTSVTGNPTTFGSADVHVDGTYSYSWDTGSIGGGSLLPGSAYGVMIMNTPVNINDALAGIYPDNYWVKLQIMIDGLRADYAVDTSSGTMPFTVAFTDVSTVSPGAINPALTVLDFGDGTSASGFSGTVYHAYSHAGTYHPMITVCDYTGACDSGTNATVTVTTASGTIPVTCPAVISSPGTYELQNDCENSPFSHPWDGILITSSDVRIDGMGHLINGYMPAPGYTDVHGIYAYSGSPLSDITIRNVTVNGTWQGIDYYEASNGRIENVSAGNNTVNIFLIYSHDNVLQNCSATAGGYGIALWPESDRNVVTGSSATGNTAGIVIYDAQDNQIVQNIFDNNGEGIYLTGTSTNNIVNASYIRHSASMGIDVELTTGNTIYNNYFLNDVNRITADVTKVNTWNIAKTSGTNIIGGPWIGGNFWGNSSGTGFSQTCTDADGDGICDTEYELDAGNYDAYPLRSASALPPDVLDAVDSVVRDPAILNNDVSRVTVSASPARVPDNTVVDPWGNDKPAFTMPYDGYFVFIDDAPNANWEHAARWVAVKEDGSQKTVFNAWSPPLDLSLEYARGKIPNPAGGEVADPAGNCPSLDCTHCYAFLISGGMNAQNNNIRYWTDIKNMYTTLRSYYCYPPGHITVLMSDGTGSGKDRLTGYSGTTAQYDNSPTDFGFGDTYSDVNGPATKVNVVNNLTALNKTLTSSDTLFIFITNHGGNDSTPRSGNSKIYLWNNESITDKEFVSYIKTMNAKAVTMAMSQCFGGGFIDDFTSSANRPSAQTRIITTAANKDEPSWASAFNYGYNNGLNGQADGQTDTGAIGDFDGVVSMQEAYAFAKLNDEYAVAGIEHPQISAAGPLTSGTMNLSACSNAINCPAVIGVNGGATPTDINKDCLFEDVNGDGVFNAKDPLFFFSNFEWIAAREPNPLAFDFNRNGRIDFADVVQLYQMSL